MNIKYIIIGLFFLLNPNINIIDILPDFIGCAFIMRGMMKCTALANNFKNSYSYFKRLLWLEIAKVPCLIFYLVIGSSDTVFYLLLSFTFGIFEIIFSVRAFAELFDGIVFTSSAKKTDEWEDPLATPVGEVKDGGFSFPEKGSVDFIRLMTLIFLTVKVLFCVLPDFTLLSNGAYGEVTEGGIFAWADYRDVFTILAFVLTLVFGIYWFVITRKYFKGLEGDKDYLPSLDRSYEETINADPFGVVKKKLFFAFSSLILGAVFSLSMNFDGINYLPRALGGVMFALASHALISVYKDTAKSSFVKSVIFSIVSFAVWVYNLAFMLSFFLPYLTNNNEWGLVASFAQVLDSELGKSFNTVYLFFGSVVLTCIEALVLILLLLSLKDLLAKIIHDHTGTSSGDIFQPTRSLFALLNATVICGIITAVCVPVQTALSVIFPPFWLVETIARILFVALFIILVVKIKEEFKIKYFIE